MQWRNQTIDAIADSSSSAGHLIYAPALLKKLKDHRPNVLNYDEGFSYPDLCPALGFEKLAFDLASQRIADAQLHLGGKASTKHDVSNILRPTGIANGGVN